VALLGPRAVRELAAALGVNPTKGLGQNFVVDANTIRRILTLSGVGPDDVVLEVGPGLGSLTLGLVATAEQVVVVEIDPVLAAALPATVDRFAPAARDRLLVVTADALRVTELPGDPPTQLVANLPYNVAVPVLLELIGRLPSLRAALVMVQLEVAQRLAAPPGSKVYGAPSAKLAWYGTARLAGTVPPTVFWPQPRVGSGLVAWRRHPEPPGGPAAGGGPEREAVFAVIDAAFAQRRKTLRAALAQLAGGVDAAAAALARAGVDPGSRGEQLDVGAFAAVAAALAPRVRP
jgi:16S rRNA (adenine1518-N6/adenine1519-N6)-dimethyltransferase